MSDQKISLYRSLNQEIIDRIGLEFSQYSFYYSDAGNEKCISKNDSSDDISIEIPGKGCQWDPSMNNLIIRRTCTIRDASVLFDLDEGIANVDAELGLSVILFSKESSQRLVYEYPGSISVNQKDMKFTLNVIVSAHMLRKEIELRTVLYLKKKSDDESLPYYSNKEGFVYGTLSDVRVYIEEQSPEFPTRVAKLGPKEPLWKLEINWNDPRVDRLEDTVVLLINESYPGYSDIWGSNADDRKKHALKLEIYSSAIMMIIDKVRADQEYWRETIEMNLSTLQDGSVCDYLCNISNLIGGYNDDSHTTAYKIRKILGEFK